MVKETKDLIPLLRQLRLFEGLDEAQLELVAAMVKTVDLSEGQVLSLPADKDYPFYLVVEGKVRRVRPLSNGKLELSTYKRGDIFGAEITLTGKRRNYRIEALRPTSLVKIEPEQLALLLRGIPPLRTNVRNQLILYRLLRRRTFNWLGEDETVYMIERRHSAYLLTSLIGPVLIGWVALLILLIFINTSSGSLRLAVNWTAILLLFVAAVWTLWKTVDWLNDYNIVTDRRVVYLHKIILLYQSREEAPLTSVKSEEVKTSFLGRMLGFGDVIVYAFLGRVVFHGVANPHKVRELVERLRKRTEATLLDADRQTMESMIRRKIDPPPETPAQPAAPVVVQRMTRRQRRQLRKRLPFAVRVRQFFQTYKEEGSVITYRKHILILIKKTWVPTLLIALVLGTAIYVFFQRTVGDWESPAFSTLILMTLLILTPLFIWWGYHYVDWRNDIYQITEDKIIDREKKPLGTEVSKSAPLENILSLDYELIGFFGVLFNLGNVIINTGTDKLTWMTIPDPARAQREIFNRMFEQRRRKQLSESKKEWDQVSDWLAAYHRQAEDLRKTQNRPSI